jgi:hypothetical protein
MLPFVKDKKEGSVSAPVESIERKPDEDKEDEFDSLESAMSELHEALNAKNYKGAAQIFRSAFELLDSEPHKEGPHIA